ncbi:MAG: hypothetical protein RIS35_2437 [Pseudomonadota bacterium]
MKVSVKGTQSDGWGLTQGKLKNADCHGAVDRWLETHSRRTVFCLVQFKNVMLTELPRIYLATSIEIASHLKRVRDGHGYTILHEDHKWSRGIAQDSHDRIPDDWRFTPERLEAVAATIASQPELARC